MRRRALGQNAVGKAGCLSGQSRLASCSVLSCGRLIVHGRGHYACCNFSWGDRADAARQASTEWFRNLNPEAGNPPSVAIPDCNDKTTAREIYLSTGFAALLWHWVLEPLKGRDEKTSWPHPGQNLHGAFLNKKPMLLFPGRVCGGQDRRKWNTAISEKAYYNALRTAAGIIQRERAEAHSQQRSHPYDDVDLDRLGTHSMKKNLCYRTVVSRTSRWQ